MNSEALVLVSYGNRGIVELPDGSQSVCSYRRSVGRPYCGDRLLVELTGEDTSLLVQIKDRDNEFAGPAKPALLELGGGRLVVDPSENNLTGFV